MMHKQNGGKKHRSKTMRRNRRKGRKTGMKKRSSTARRSKTMRRKARKNHKGGFLAGAMGAAREALLPLLMYSAQKHQQKRVRKTRRSRK